MPKNSVREWDTTSTANTDVGGTGINEGCDPGNINDAIRKVMAQTAEWFGDTNGSLVSGGSASAYTLTTNEGVTAYAQGMVFTFEANHASTGASTLTVDGLAAKAITKNNDVALAAGDIESGQIVMVAYEAAADAFQMLSPVAVEPLTSLSSNVVLTDATKNLTVGVTSDVEALGNSGTGTVTPDLTTESLKSLTINGSFTLGVPASGNGVAVILATVDATGSYTMTTSAYDKVIGSFNNAANAENLFTIYKIGSYNILRIEDVAN